MADELDGQIKAVEAEIAEVKGEIKDDSDQLKLILAQLAEPELRKERRDELQESVKWLRAEVHRLGTEVQRLGTKEHDLREEKKLLMAKQQQGVSAGSGSAATAGASLLNSFKMLLNKAGVAVDGNVIDTIIQFPNLRDQLNYSYDIERATSLYELAQKVPRTKTRLSVLAETGIVIDGPMHVMGIQSALFFHAFRQDESGNFVPNVLKVPPKSGQAAIECKMWQELGSAATSSGLSLVPVTYVELKGQHTTLLSLQHPDVRCIPAGLLMPQYACTLANMPVPVNETYSLHVFERITAALAFMHEHAWMHGDVKPSNIFIDTAGLSWLGDYGSSQPFSAFSLYTGGTPAYQCEEALTQLQMGRSLIWFDKIALTISILCRLGLVDVRSVINSWPLQTIQAAACRINSEQLKGKIMVTLSDDWLIQNV